MAPKEEQEVEEKQEMAQQQRRVEEEGAASPPPPAGVKIDILPIHVSLLRFFMILVVAWIMSYAAMRANAAWAVDTYVPWSFWLLHFLVIFGIVGGGWPCVAPFGFDAAKPHWGGHGRVWLGLTMSGLAIGAGAILSAFFVKVWPAYPLSPGGAWFGIGLFYMTLWWVLDIQTTPKPLLPMLSSPPLNMMMHSLFIIVLSVAIFQFVNFEGPAAVDPSNPEGPFDASYWFALCVSIIAWVHNFASILVLQGWPFSLIPNPILSHFALTAVTIGLGIAQLEVLIALGVDPGFYANAVGASQISWSLYHTMAFDFWPFHNVKQPKR